MGAQPFSIETYLTVQILEMIGLGPLHALTWAGKMDLDHWLQMSVHGGQTNYLMIQCVLPERVNKGRVDRAFGHTGWIHFQADRRDCLVYYLARSESQWDLREQAPEVAKRCAAAMRTMWNVSKLDQLALLGARGPQIPLEAAAADLTPVRAHINIA